MGPDVHHDRFERWRRLARKVPGAMSLLRRLRLVFDRELASVERLRRGGDPALLQVWPTTWDERYPALFDALAERLADVPVPNILSFGCASGAEVRALRKRIPHARITGIDLNRRAIRQAKRRDPSHAANYLLTATPPLGPYDAVLALAVLRHGDLEAFGPDDCSAVLPYSRFAATLETLDAALKAGGWLAIAHCQFAFSALSLASHYEADALDLPELAPGHLYGADDKRRPAPARVPVLYRKA